MVSGCGIIIKYILFIFNLVFFIAGIALVAAGAVVLAEFESYITFLGKDAQGAPIAIIVIGVFVLIFAFLGCLGAIRENDKELIAYAVMIGIIVICEIGVGIAAYVLKDKIIGVIHDNAIKTIPDYGLNSTESERSLNKLWNVIQQDFKCCGVVSYRDWINNKQLNKDGVKSVPDSCCKKETKKCGNGALTISHTVNGGKNKDTGSDTAAGSSSPDGNKSTQSKGNSRRRRAADTTSKPISPIISDTFYTEGCQEAIASKIESDTEVLGIVGIVIAVIEILGVIFACVLAHDIKKHKYDNLA